MAEFTFFVDAEPYMMSGAALPATEQDLFEMQLGDLERVIARAD